MSEKHVPYAPDVAVAPGESLRETLETLALSQAELARRTGRPLKTINEIIQGKAAITPDTAIQLERALGVPASFWNARERAYRERLAGLKARQEVLGQVSEATRFPYSAMAGLGWVPPTRDKAQRVESLLSFFGVSSLGNVARVHEVAFRMKARDRIDERAVAAWLRRGETQARKINVADYSVDRLRSVLKDLVSLSTGNASLWSEALVRTCAGAGLAVVFVPHLPKTRVHGATRWIGVGRPMVQMSIRGRYEDIFWFSFFHEIGHILLHGRREAFLEADGMVTNAKEREADEFAAETLIPSRSFKHWTLERDFSAPSVKAFAARQGVAAGIVVGRLQHDGLVPHSSLNGLRRRLKWDGE